MLERLDNIEVGSLTLGETILSVELELGSDDGVLSPAVHVEGRLGEDEGAGIGEASAASSTFSEGTGGGPVSIRGGGNVNTSGLLEEAVGGNEAVGSGDRVLGPERVEGVGEGINGIGVVEGLGAEGLVEGVASNEGRAVVDVGVGLNDPNELLARVVEVELDLVGTGSNGLVSSELELLEEVLVGVLRHLPALIRVEEDIIDVEGGGNKGLLVGSGDGDGGRGRRDKVPDGPEALADGAEIKVDLDLVVLEGNEGEGKSRVAAEPELEGHVEGGLREGVAGSANLGRSAGSRAGPVDGGKGGVSDVRKLSGVSNHLEVPTLLLRGEGDLIPDVHPVSVLAIDALASNLDLDLGNELLADEVHPAGIDAGVGSTLHALVDLGESHLEVGAVSKISVSGDGAGDTATEISLSREGLLDRLHREVSVAPVRHLPEGDLGGTSEENVLCAVSYELH